jgi:hypothetical protein
MQESAGLAAAALGGGLATTTVVKRLYSSKSFKKLKPGRRKIALYNSTFNTV